MTERQWKEPIMKVTVEKMAMAPGTEWKRQLFNIRLQESGELIATLSYEAELEACRELLARGITGTLETWWPGSPHASMRFDIEGASKLSLRDDDKGTYFTPHKPLTEQQKASFRAIAEKRKAERAAKKSDPAA